MSAEAAVYASLGVSSSKQQVHDAIEKCDKGYYPGAFCTMQEDESDPQYCGVLHADGAGTKSIVSYLVAKEFGDVQVMMKISEDAIVMNINDILCVGGTGPFLLSSTVGRNKKHITADMIKNVIHGTTMFISKMKKKGIFITSMGGETADVGDLVRTLIVDSTVYSRIPKQDVVDISRLNFNKEMPKNLVIVGISSTGQSAYEYEENSGIASNGLTLARHALIGTHYWNKYNEIYDNESNVNIKQCKEYKLTDHVPHSNMTIAQALTSPTRCYAPIILHVLNLANARNHIYGIVHCTGGGQTKAVKFGKRVHYIKDTLFQPPAIFDLIRTQKNVPYREMYQVFNMGHLMEIITTEEFSKQIIEICEKYNVKAKIVGKTVDNADPGNKVSITTPHGIEIYTQ